MNSSSGLAQLKPASYYNLLVRTYLVLFPANKPASHISIEVLYHQTGHSSTLSLASLNLSQLHTTISVSTDINYFVLFPANKPASHISIEVLYHQTGNSFSGLAELKPASYYNLLVRTYLV